MRRLVRVRGGPYSSLQPWEMFATVGDVWYEQECLGQFVATT